MKTLLTMMVAAFFGCPLFGALTDGLVAHYKFDGNANDSSGNGNNGVVHGATLTTDRFGNANSAYSFDGNDWIQASNVDTLRSVAKSVTVSAWIKPTGWYENVLGLWLPVVRMGGNDDATWGLQLQYQPVGSSYWVRQSKDGYWIEGCAAGDVYSSRDIKIGAWQLVTLTYDGSTTRCYVDGVESGSLAGNLNWDGSDEDFYIGADLCGGDEYFKGGIDDVRIYNRALSAAEVKALYDGDGLVAHYKFDGDAKDSSGYGNNGVVHGATLTTDRFGNPNSAYLFDGNDDWIEVTHSESLSVEDMTVSVWLKPNGWSHSNGDWIPVICKANYSYAEGSYRFEILKDGDGADYQLKGEVYSAAGVTFGQWQQITVTLGSDGLKVYHNGLFIGVDTSTDRIENLSDVLAIGRSLVGSTEYYNGVMDDLRIYNRALSATEVKTLYGEDADGLVAHYKFDGNANDSSANGYNLTSCEDCGLPVLTSDRNGNANSAYLFDGSKAQRLGSVDELQRMNAPRSTFTFALWFQTEASYADYGAGWAWNLGNYAFAPINGDVIESGLAGLGVKVGRDGIEVVEHSGFYMPTVLSYHETIGTAWNHLAVTIENDGKPILYLNGVKVGEGEKTDRVKCVWADAVGGLDWGYYTGKVDDLCIYNRALSAEEVKALYEGDDALETWYVNGTSGSDDYSGKSPALAKKTIQAAIDASSSGDTILVAAGTYAPIKTFNKKITISSTTGAETTVIDGQGKYRCVMVSCDDRDEDRFSEANNSTNTVIRGFTITRGFTDGEHENTYGAGAFGGSFYNCIFSNNGSNAVGGGGCHNGILFNCLLIGNVARNGGAAEGCVLKNCTIVGNRARDNGAAGFNCAFANCIICGNDGYTILYTVEFWANALVLDVNGLFVSNYEQDPKFVDAANGNYRLAANSPCIDAGDNSYVVGSSDLDGNARIVNGKVDIGCYEYATRPSAAHLYMVIDLSGGATAGSYPVSYLDVVPAGGWTDEYKTTKLVMRRIEPGTFVMGCASDEVGFSGDDSMFPPCTVTLTRPYYIGVFQVTQKQYELVTGENPSYYSGATRPVETVSYDILRGADKGSGWPQSSDVDDDTFMALIRQKTGINTFDLPTDAQWEYACRAGTTTALNSGKDLQDEFEDAGLDKLAQYRNRSDGTSVVGSFLPNAWGLYDMHGNVWEWCLDWFDYGDGASVAVDPVGPPQKRDWGDAARVFRGGAHNRDARECRSGHRGNYGCYRVSHLWGDFGFRLAMTCKESDVDPVATKCAVTFDATGGTAGWTKGEVVKGAVIGTLPTAMRAGYEFLGWFTAAVGGTQVTAATVVTGNVMYYAQWTPICYAITYVNTMGAANPNPTSYMIEDAVTFAALPDVEGWRFVGWSFAGISRGNTGDVTVSANWEAVTPSIIPDEEEPMDAGVANTYDGIIMDADGLPVGYISIKAAKATGKGEVKTSKVTATIQMVGEAKKVTVKGNVNVSEATFVQAAADGRVLDLMFTRNSIFGTFDGYEIEGVRNILASTDKGDKGSEAKRRAEAIYNRLTGNYVMAYGDENGWNGLSISVAAKGKVKVSGKLADGTSVATSTQLIVGEDYSCIPVIYTKKDVSLAFSIYFSNDGGESSVFGYYDAVISRVTALGGERTFCLDGNLYGLFAEAGYELVEDFLPWEVTVAPNGTKWIVADGAKAGQIKMDKDGEVYDKKESDNPSGIKLTLTAKTGLFKGSFKAYAIDAKGKLKSFSATVNGIVVDGLGYGTATIKKIGSVPVAIE